MDSDQKNSLNLVEDCKEIELIVGIDDVSIDNFREAYHNILKSIDRRASDADKLSKN